ncbi:MAG: LPXTG cell wall anchor domain-containing protein [Actinomycetales bacterium]|nr:LPXTG cell wall anchor domain-containing protein [Actinomycetales bacterium]
MSAENPKVPSNPVTVTSSKTELPKTGADGLGVAYLGMLLAALGAGLMFIARRRRDEEESA